MPRRRNRHRLPHAAATAVVLAAALACSGVAGAGAANEGALRQQIQRSRGHEHALASAAARLGRLERATAREIAILQRRLAGVQHDLDVHQAQLSRTQADLSAERARLRRLRARLEQSRATLAALLRDRYMADKPDLVTVVLNAHGFKDLLEQMSFLHRVEDRDTIIIGTVRTAKVDSARAEQTLTVLERRQHDATEAVRRERNALATLNGALQRRRAALAQARAARLAALRNTRAGRARAEHALSRLLAARARFLNAPGPGGPWAIPWAIVQCESGGQNLPPNSATASGYYQFLDSTWHGLGGSTPHAYQAPKAEQDRLAGQLWAGGSGASNWDCAALVGAL